MTQNRKPSTAASGGISSERLAEIEAIKDEDIDTSDIPEAGADFFANAKQSKLIRNLIPASSSYDPADEIVPFEAHRLAKENGFVLQNWNGGLLFVRNDGQVTVKVGLLNGEGVYGDPDVPLWTVWKEEYRPSADGASVVTVGAGMRLAGVFSRLVDVPAPFFHKDGSKSTNIIESWSKLPHRGLEASQAQFEASPLKQALNKRNEVLAGDLKIAIESGFAIYNTGGNIFSFRKDRPNNEDGYWLIDDDSSLTSSATELVWRVGHYATFAGQESWVFVEEPVTLVQALEGYGSVPLPQPTDDGKPNERSVQTWSDIEVSIEAASPKI